MWATRGPRALSVTYQHKAGCVSGRRSLYICDQTYQYKAKHLAILRSLYTSTQPQVFLTTGKDLQLHQALSRSYSSLVNLTDQSQRQSRNHTSSAQSPSSLDIFHNVFQNGPAFPIAASDIEILHEPSVFAQRLTDGIAGAEKRVVVASLYLGTGAQEKAIVQALETASSNGASVEVLLDGLRGSRGDPSSCTMLVPLVSNSSKPDMSEGSQNKGDVKVCMFRTPDFRGILTRLPDRFNEVIGLQHMKVYLFDDTVMLSGANLSDWYFVDRQDRY
ncbi:hypothetical protein SARC_11719, partial [Sphaeroforma arctica JP610]